MKKIIVLISCFAIMVALLAMPASAASQDEVAQIRRQITRDYSIALSGTEKESLGGFCGLMTSWQLYLMGINPYVITQDGNNQYDYYCNMKRTAGGYPVRAYSAEEYSLEEALNMITNNGTRNAYNILVGFQWTNTEAGAMYGHAVVVYAILDGMVYFTEGYDTSLGTVEGQAIALSIQNFAKYYDDWTTFEGVIVFGKKEYIENCSVRDAYLFAKAENATKIYSLPCTPSMDIATPISLRKVIPGERLLVTGLVENTWSQYFYRVEDGGQIGYVPADQLTPIRFNHEDLTLTDAVFPQVLQEGQNFMMGGTVSATYSGVSNVWVAVYDAKGWRLLYRRIEAENGICVLDDKIIDLSGLPVGQYSYRIYAAGENNYADGMYLKKERNTVCLLDRLFSVGQNSVVIFAGVAEERTIKDGWHWENGNWYYYEQGTPRTGWFQDDGVTYYLQEDGAAATRWMLIDEKYYYFSDTGAMCTGWVVTDEGKYYFLSSGALAINSRTLGRK